MFDYCTNNIKGIIFFKIEKERVTELRTTLKTRFELSRTISGSRSYHQFKPESIDTISFKRTSEDVHITGFFSFSGIQSSQNDQQINIDALKLGEFIMCKYDAFDWIGMINEIDNIEQDVMVTFMHPHGPFNKLFWLSRVDECWVPITNITCIIDAPVTTNGRFYTLTVDASKLILTLS